MKTELLGGIRRIGDLPKSSDKSTPLYIFVSTTPTEKSVLKAFAEHNIDDETAILTWVQDDRTADAFHSEGLTEALNLDQKYTLIPVGVTWAPQKSESLSWTEIVSWSRLLDSSWRQKRLLKSSPDRCVVIIGESGTRAQLKAKYDRFAALGDVSEMSGGDDFSDFVALQAGLTLDRDSRQVTGQTVKYPRFVKRSIWQRRDFQSTLDNLAAQSVRTRAEIAEDARGCLDELVPTTRAPHVSFSTNLFRKITSLGYDSGIVYDKKKMKELRELALKKPMALMWTHKTHIDGPAMILASRDENFPLVHIVGGENMAFAGIGYLMRRSGTIFIRRKIDSDVYKTVMRYYLSYLMEKRFPVSWALEGTRSRNGKLMPPRFGILKYVVEAAAKDNTKDFTIVPISIYYDLIAELGDYAREQTGKTKRKESLAWFISYVRSLRKPLGRISLGLGDPITVDTTNSAFTQAVEGDDARFSIELQKLAFQASVNANAVTPITPSSIIALILTGAAPRALLLKEILRDAVAIMKWAKVRGYPMDKAMLSSNSAKVADIANAMIDMGVVSEYDGGHQTVYSINPDKQFEASYYRNNSIHFFVNKSIIELSLIVACEGRKTTALKRFWAETNRLRDLFKFEFFYPETEIYQAEISTELARYDQNWETSISSGNSKDLLAKMTPHLAHSVLRAFTEAYAIVADVLYEKKNNQAELQDIVSDCLKRGKQAMLQRRITSEESIGKLMFSNGAKLAQNRGLLSKNQKSERGFFVDDIDDVARKLRIVNALSDERRQ